MRRSTRVFHRSGITLLELVISSSMLAILATSLGLVLRTSRTAWESGDSHYAAQQHAQSVVMHFVRQARETRGVLSISSSRIQLEQRDGGTMEWSLQPVGPTGQPGTIMVNYSSPAQEIPLAYGVSNLSFSGFEADGVTPSSQVNKIRLVEVRATINVVGSAVAQQTFSSRVWIRAW